MHYPVPKWFEQFRCNYLAGNNHQFVFDGNIDDTFFQPDDYATSRFPAGNLLPLRDLLINSLLRSFAYVFTYAPTAGIGIYGSNPEGGRTVLFPYQDGTSARGAGKGADLVAYVEGFRKSVKDVEDRHVPVTSESINDMVLEAFLQIEGVLSRQWGEGQDDIRVAVMIDYFDKILTTSDERMVRHLTEQVQRWAIDPKIAGTKNTCLLLAENRDNLPRAFQSDEGGTLPIRVSFPDRDYRSLYFQQQKGTATPMGLFLQAGDAMAQAVQLTQGFKLADCQRIERIARIAAAEGDSASVLRKHFFPKTEEVSGEDLLGLLLREKRDVINVNSRGMLEPLESKIRFDNIGGLRGVQDYFRRIAEAIRDRDAKPALAETIPKGVLLAGPPGTGKTLIAKALAQEAGISLVKMGDIRSMWVGESERNLSLVLNLLREMEPVIVFIDEVDQAIGSRSTAPGDSGVGGRIFGKILEFMGDNDNRGKVIWVAATNRADLLDEAMKSRFDRIIPVLLPGSEAEWVSVIDGINRQIKSRIALNDIGEFVRDNLEMIRRNHSGRSMEMILRLAYQLALESGTALDSACLARAFNSVKSNFDQNTYMLQTLLAIEACNEVGFIPRAGSDYSYGYGEEFDTIVNTAIDERSNRPLVVERTRIQRALAYP